MSVLALALKRLALSHRDNPSTVPAGQALGREPGGTNGTSGTSGTVGTVATRGAVAPLLPDYDADAIEERAGLASDRVPAVYLDAWSRLNCQKPASVSDAEWRLALDDGGRFLDAWGGGAAEAEWMPGEMFEKLHVEAGEAVRKLEIERLNELQSAYYDKAVQGDIMANQQVLAITDRRNRITGALAPVKVESVNKDEVSVRMVEKRLQASMAG